MYKKTIKLLCYGLIVLAMLVSTASLTTPAVSADGPSIKLQPLGTFNTGVFDEGAAEIVAHDPKTQRLFVVNANAATVDVLNLADPGNPTLLFSIDATQYGDSANSVAVNKGVVAVAVEAAEKTDPGQAVFFDTNGNFLNAVEVGALPDMITFSPNGRYVLVANEGEPNDDYTVDPEGTVSIIDISSGVSNLTQSAVRTADFKKFNNGKLDESIRIFGPGATVAQDLEPEYITISNNSRLAYVTLQENNAMAVIDIRRARVNEIIGLGFKNHAAHLETATFEDLPLLGTTAAGQEILLGGFSGLFFEGIQNGLLVFVTHPDRGPNAEPIDTDGDGDRERPFPLPDFQSRIVRFAYDPYNGSVKILDQILLTRPDGVTPITGLPNLAGTAGLAYADEEPIDLFGNQLALDPFGADMEGIVIAEDGSFWMVDEYRPAIYHFNPAGVLIDRFVPEGSSSSVDTGTEAIPAVFAQRRANRGFEAVAYDNGRLYAFIQSPIDDPDTTNDANSRAGDFIRMLEFDTTTGQTVGQYVYLIEGNGSDKIGDAVALGNGEFLVLERDDATGPAALKKVFRISINEATNLETLDPALVGPAAGLELLDADGLAAAGISPVSKMVFIDLIALGYDFADKPEGLALVDEKTIAVLNDNDFQLVGSFDPATGLLDPNPNPTQPVLGLIKLENALDASDRDDAINITSWPVLGMYQPDAIALYRLKGQDYLVTANEGDARDYDGFAEEERVKDLDLDPTAFPNADGLQEDEAIGRLTVTSVNGDTDGDGDFDQLYAYGSRSFSIWNKNGQRIYDSGADFERITAKLLPADFNATNDENDTFDNRSDNKGPEPEGVIVGRAYGRTYAFIGLERIGGVMVYDITDPYSAHFVTYVNNRDFNGDAEAGTAGDLGPEGLAFISQKDSPIKKPLLVISNEVSGSTSVFSIEKSR